MDEYTMILLLIAVVAALVGIGYILWIIKYECIKKAKEDNAIHAKEHAVIKEIIRLADNKTMELEIRVKVLENK